MATIEFNTVITDEAITYARFASTNSGWKLVPKRWAITTASGELSSTRTTDSMYTPWISQPFSGVYESGTNKLLHSIVIPPDAYATDMNIGEIYFIYEDYYGNEFLYAISQPTSSVVFTNGISQSYTYVFTLNNTNVADTYTVEYTYPQDIEDHNKRADAHEWLLSRDGSRKADAVLAYSQKLEFTDPRQIVDKEYTDRVTDIIKDAINASYCPPGSMMWWPKTTPPNGWLVRDGAAISRTTYANLYAILGTTYGAGNGSTTFNLPDDRGRFIRGYLSGTTANFGQVQSDGLPNLKGTFSGHNSTDGVLFTHSGSYWHGNRNNNGQKTNITFDASRYNSIYGAASEVRPKNRNYLPIIKY